MGRASPVSLNTDLQVLDLSPISKVIRSHGLFPTMSPHSFSAGHWSFVREWGGRWGKRAGTDERVVYHFR